MRKANLNNYFVKVLCVCDSEKFLQAKSVPFLRDSHWDQFLAYLSTELKESLFFFFFEFWLCKNGVSSPNMKVKKNLFWNIWKVKEG